MPELKEALANATLVLLDVETWKVKAFTGRTLMGVAIGIPNGLTCDKYYVLPEELHLYKDLLEDKDIIAHNILFDAQIMLENGIELKGKWWDTMIMTHISNENELSYKLDWLSKKYFGETKQDMKALEKGFGGWNNIPSALMGPYAMNDIHLTWRLFLHALGRLEEQSLLKVYETYEKFLKCMRWVQAQGIWVDWELVQQKREETEAEMREIKIKLGYAPLRITDINRRFYTQLKMKPVALTKKGSPQTDVAAIQTLIRRYPEHREELQTVLRFRALSKANSNWYAGYQQYKDSAGLLHPSFKVHGTKTGRASCETPNLQQIPRDYSRVKVLFRNSPDGSETLVELDFSQIELRVGADYARRRGNDSTMYNVYVEGADVHTVTTEMVGAFDQIPDRAEARQVGKTGNFLWIYGGGAATMSRQLFRQFKFRSTEEQCREWGSKFHAAYPGFNASIEYYADLHKRRGYITLWNGRRRRIKEKDRYGRIAHRKAFNAVVQGGCSQLLMYGLIRIHRAVEAGKVHARVVNTVHDSVWVYVPTAGLEEEVPKLQALMKQTAEAKFPLPFEIDCKPLVKVVT